MAPYFLKNWVPKRETRGEARPLLTVLSELTWLQWAQFWTGWLAWCCDSIDFFSVALTVPLLQKQFHKEGASSITTAITLTLLFRPVGALLFGILSDRFGRKWPLIANLLVICSLQLGVAFVQTFKQFLAVRSLFGIGMGGIWGLSASTALENLPVEARGIASGVLQQGYAVGYLFAACINLKLVPVVAVGWRVMFFTVSGISFSTAFLRFLLPESEVFLRAKEAERTGGLDTRTKSKIFVKETKNMLKTHWMMCIYAVLLMTGFNFLSHGSQDLYPTYLQVTKGFTPHQATIATIIGSCGAVSGGLVAGWISQYIGRRLTIIIFVTMVACFIPLWILPNTFSSLAAGAFCLQFGVQGAWGVIPIFLTEMSPPAFRATFPGVVYQLGNMVSSAASQIEATAADNIKTTIIKNGMPTVVPDYATVQGILIGVISGFVIVVTFFGPENHGSHFEKAKTAFEEGGGRDELAELPDVLTAKRHNSMDDDKATDHMEIRLT